MYSNSNTHPHTDCKNTVRSEYTQSYLGYCGGGQSSLMKNVNGTIIAV